MPGSSSLLHNPPPPLLVRSSIPLPSFLSFLPSTPTSWSTLIHGNFNPVLYYHSLILCQEEPGLYAPPFVSLIVWTAASTCISESLATRLSLFFFVWSYFDSKKSIWIFLTFLYITVRSFFSLRINIFIVQSVSTFFWSVFDITLWINCLCVCSGDRVMECQCVSLLFLLFLSLPPSAYRRVPYHFSFAGNLPRRASLPSRSHYSW